MSTHIVGIIPARLASTRLPRKLLLNETGKTVLQHTWERVIKAQRLTQVVIAADAPEIVDAVRSFGGDCEMTGEHPSGTDRIAEVVRRRFPAAEIVINIQGDEPEIDPAAIDHCAELLANEPRADMSTLCRPIHSKEELESTACVKVVAAANGRALYFSRCPIPHVRDADPRTLLGDASPWRLHVGMYGYRREFLLKLTQLPVSQLEALEKLEQLRALDCGGWIQLGTVQSTSVGIDTPADYARFVQRTRDAL